MQDYSQYTEQEIIAFVSKWETDAYSRLVELYQNKLLKYIHKISYISLEEAENLLQEVFIKAYKNIHSYNPKYSFSSWIYRITHNHTIDYYKKHKNTKTVQLETDANDGKKLLDILASDENIEQNLQKQELFEVIGNILKDMDIKYREVLVLKFLQEKSYDEISDILHIPSWTVATLINRGKKQFKQLSEHYNIHHYF